MSSTSKSFSLFNGFIFFNPSFIRYFVLNLRFSCVLCISLGCFLCGFIFLACLCSRAFLHVFVLFCLILFLVSGWPFIFQSSVPEVLGVAHQQASAGYLGDLHPCWWRFLDAWCRPSRPQSRGKLEFCSAPSIFVPSQTLSALGLVPWIQSLPAFWEATWKQCFLLRTPDVVSSCPTRLLCLSLCLHSLHCCHAL